MIVNSEYENAAQECAHFIFDSEWIQDSYTDHVSIGEDPREHILYDAAIILGKTENFQQDIEEYLNER